MSHVWETFTNVLDLDFVAKMDLYIFCKKNNIQDGGLAILGLVNAIASQWLQSAKVRAVLTRKGIARAVLNQIRFSLR
jgi:hypothetical protein